MDKQLAGIIVAMITPFKADESLDEEGLRVVTRFLIERGVHGLFPGGSQGEFYALSTDERQRVLEVTLDAAQEQVFVVAHVGAVTTREAVSLARRAEAAGADALAAITPYFIKPSQEELYRYYMDIASAVSLPVMAYDNIGRTGVPMPPATVARIARDAPNFSGIKDSSGDLTQFAEHLRLCPPGFRAFVGRDSLIYAALLHGGTGAVTATANVVPDLAVGIYDAVAAGDLGEARALQERLLPVRLAFGLGTFPMVVKEAMHMLGLPAGPARQPVGPLSEEARAKLRQVLEDAGALR
ncbi:MAG: 4-hydroxy-tetrahydrodipicolinate synthase [Anaerolineae bacterium]|nr:4-hydroxy-tetrahydrodipicolinate synthase [Anaerolineae bacterium]